MDTAASCKSPLGFYVDLNDVPVEPPPPPQPPAQQKNIFSMVIDFEAPKKDMPSRLSSSLIARRKVRDKRTRDNNNSSRSLSAASSSSSYNGESFTRNGDEAARNSSSSSLCSNAEGNQSVSASASDINDIMKEKDVEEHVEVEQEAGGDTEEGVHGTETEVQEREDEEQKEIAEEKEELPPQKEAQNGGSDSQVIFLNVFNLIHRKTVANIIKLNVYSYLKFSRYNGNKKKNSNNRNSQWFLVFI